MPAEPVQQITAYGPHWSVWWGRATGRYWAVPLWHGAPEVMLEAGSVEELDEKMTDVERESGHTDG